MMKCQPKQKKSLNGRFFVSTLEFSVFFRFFFVFARFFFLFFFSLWGGMGGRGRGCVCVWSSSAIDRQTSATLRIRGIKKNVFFFAVLGFFSFVSAERRENRTTQPQQRNLVLPSFTEFSCVCVLFFLQFRASRGFRRGDLSVERLANERGVPFESPDHSFTDETIL